MYLEGFDDNFVLIDLRKGLSEENVEKINEILDINFEHI